MRSKFLGNLDRSKQILKAVKTDYEEQIEAEQNAPKARGLSSVNMVDPSNFILVFGCEPAAGVKANTQMIKEITDLMLETYEKDFFSLTFPRVLD